MLQHQHYYIHLPTDCFHVHELITCSECLCCDITSSWDTSSCAHAVQLHPGSSHTPLQQWQVRTLFPQ